MSMPRNAAARCLALVFAVTLALLIASSSPVLAGTSELSPSPVLAVTSVLSPSPVLADTSVLSPSPTSWDFGDIDIHSGNLPTQTVTFSDNVPSIVTVNNVDIVGPDASAFQLTDNGCQNAILVQSDSCSVQVTFEAITTGTQTASLEITDTTGTLDVPLSGTGISGTLTASPNAVVFGAQPYYNGGQQVGLNIQNSNDAGVQATSGTITGPDAADFYIANGQNCWSQEYGTGSSCQMNIGFNPPNGPGTFQAQLEITSDSVSSPLVIPITATSLNGPHPVLSPPETDFGDVAIGHSAAQVMTVSNDGDYPMQVQGTLLITSTPLDLPITADQCSGQIVDPGAFCQFTVTYRPTAARALNATVLLLTSANGAPTPTGFTGDGVPTIHGTASVTGNLAAGSTLTCNPAGDPSGTHYTYRWLRDGDLVADAHSRQLALGDSAVGAHFACRIVASNTVSRQTVTSRRTAEIAPMNLALLQGAFTDQGTCRTIAAGHVVRLGRHEVTVSYGAPSTPWAPLTLTAASTLQVNIDGQRVGTGTLVTLSPQTLSTFANGRHTLTIVSAGTVGKNPLVLGTCSLAVRLNGGPGQATTLSASSQYGLSTLSFRLPSSLYLDTGFARKLGWATVTSAGYPISGFNLVGSRTTSNAVTVTVTAHTVTVTNLPPRTGVMSVTLRPGVLSGVTGIVGLAARQRGSRSVLGATAPASWLP